MFRSADDQNDVVILLDVTDVAKACAWYGSSEMKSVLEKSGVVGSPSIRAAAYLVAKTVHNRDVSSVIASLSRQLKRQRPKYRLGAGADLQLQKDMLYVRFHCLG